MNPSRGRCEENSSRTLRVALVIRRDAFVEPLVHGISTKPSRSTGAPWRLHVLKAQRRHHGVCTRASRRVREEFSSQWPREGLKNGPIQPARRHVPRSLHGEGLIREIMTGPRTSCTQPILFLMFFDRSSKGIFRRSTQIPS